MRIQVLLTSLFFAVNVNSAGLDPYSRDEDISNTTVTVSVEQMPNGLYKYNYSIASNSLNKGEISGFDLNIQCDQVADSAGLPIQETGIWFIDFSKTNKHSPVIIFSGEAAKSAPMAGFSANNWAGWGVFLKPGEVASGFGLISSKPPVMREYKLTPSMDTGYPWDYSNVDSEDPNLPWIDDFTITGMTKGPGCRTSEPKDPRFRDENISLTNVSVGYHLDMYGNYVYSYSIDSSENNIGRILSFNIDISCETHPGFPDFDPSKYPAPDMDDFSRDNLHVPAVVTAPYGEAALFGIDVNNSVGWGVFLAPGNGRQGLTIASPAAPGIRQYTLIPSMDNSEEWDYASFDENDPSVPWIDDFTVYGTTTGPACPGEEMPPEGHRFAGTLMPHETEQSNALLTYSEPLQDRFHVPPGTGQIAITIHYADNLDADSFKLTPRRPEYRDLFHPEAGASETVYVPLSHKKTKLILSACPQGGTADSDTADKPAQDKQHGPDGCSHKDRDVFEIRLSE